MSARISDRRYVAYGLVMLGCLQFVVLTFVAMLLYRGGTALDSTASRYRFFENFFSELGLVETYSGSTNTISMLLFMFALTIAGLGLALFFIINPLLCRSNRAAYVLSIFGSIFGILSGLSFVGVAFTPADRFLSMHYNFVIMAFITFFMAVLFYIPSILLEKSYPNVYAAVFAIFALILGGYIWLIFNGPAPESVDGRTVQVTGQKIIAYAAIISIFIQAYGGRRIVAAGERMPVQVGDAALNES